MSTRVICPLSVSFPSDNTTTSNGSRNYLLVDALEYAEISCRQGSIERLCTRVSLRIPWSPVLFVAVRDEYIGELRRDINLALCARRCIGGVTAIPRMAVRGQVRSNARVLWSQRDDMTLHELRFETYRARGVARTLLRENVTARSDDYLLFAVDDNAAFDVALASYLRNDEHSNATLLDRDALNSSSSDGGGIDLNEVFELCSWCRLDETVGERMTKLSQRELRMNGLVANPLTTLPIVSYDIETIARTNSAIPRGTEHDHMLSSIALTIHTPATNIAASIVLAYAPMASTPEFDNDRQDESRCVIDDDDDDYDDETRRCGDRLLEVEKRLLAEFRSAQHRADPKSSVPPPCNVLLFDNERQLLFDAVTMLQTNDFLVDLYQLDDPVDAERLACILIGYNCWEYDYSFLWCRLLYYGMYEHALGILRLWREPRFCAAQISFDLMMHVRARYGAQVGSLALENVARMFGAKEQSENGLTAEERQLKMNFDSVSIRRLYFDEHGIKRFDAVNAFAFDADHGLNLLRVLLYNTQDCRTVYHLATNLNFLDGIVVYARHFVVDVVSASHVGNSRLLPNAFAVRALQESRTLLHRRINRLSMFTVTRAARADERYSAREWYDCCATGKRSLDSDESGCFSTIAASTKLRSFTRVYPSDNSNDCDDTGNSNNDNRNNSNAFGNCTDDKVVPLEVTRCSDLTHMNDELSLMRIGDKVYLGGVNSANAGHYRRPITIDFSSFYPSIGCQFGLSMETVRVLSVEELIRAFGNDCLVIDESIEYGMIRVFDYEPVDSINRKRDLTYKSRAADTRAIDITDSDHNNDSKSNVFVIHGRNDLATSVIRYNHGWYEGVEFSNIREMIDSSVNVARRRVLLVYRPSPAYTPVISGLWRYYLSQRKQYKTLLKSAAESSLRQVYTCMEKMYKIVANSLYGYLNYEHSAIYAPAVAAAVTLLSRKTFYETTWISEYQFPRSVALASSAFDSRCSVVYRDTDGLMLHVVRRPRRRPLGNESTDHTGYDDITALTEVTANDSKDHSVRTIEAATAVAAMQREDERAIVSLVNSTFRAHNCPGLAVELEDTGLVTSTVMGKKKYWKCTGENAFVTKGFEKNAQHFVKTLVRNLQRNMSILMRECVPAALDCFHLVVVDTMQFFVAMYEALDTYYRRNGVRSFVFSIALNPRSTQGVEATFIQDTLTRYDFAVGDRARCVFALDPGDPTATKFALERDHRPEDRINYYKFVRRLSVYFLQLVEGFKRTRDRDDIAYHSPNNEWASTVATTAEAAASKTAAAKTATATAAAAAVITVTTVRAQSLKHIRPHRDDPLYAPFDIVDENVQLPRMRAVEFDEVLRRAYQHWLSSSTDSRQRVTSSYSALFVDDEADDVRSRDDLARMIDDELLLLYTSNVLV